MLFEEWRTLYEMEPWADERADYAAGAIVASLNNDEGKIVELARKYMPFLKKPPHKATIGRGYESRMGGDL